MNFLSESKTDIEKEKEAIVREDNLLRLNLICRTGFSTLEVDALLYYIISTRVLKNYGIHLPNNFKKDTLLCRQVLNRFSKEKNIRFEDALDVLTEWALMD
jgi:hypothetical protein